MQEIRGMATVTLPRAAGAEATDIKEEAEDCRPILCCTHIQPPTPSLVCPMEIKQAAETCRTHGV